MSADHGVFARTWLVRNEIVRCILHIAYESNETSRKLALAAQIDDVSRVDFDHEPLCAGHKLEALGFSILARAVPVSVKPSVKAIAAFRIGIPVSRFSDLAHARPPESIAG
jgi:hypothetical protein